MHSFVQNILPHFIDNIYRNFYIMCFLQASWFIWEALGRTGVWGLGGFDWWPCWAVEFERLWSKGEAESTTGQWPHQKKLAGPATSAFTAKPLCTQLLHKRQSWRSWHPNVFSFVIISHLMNYVTIAGACEPDQYHALSVMEWLDVDRVAGDKVQLLRIRNPWGRGCWGGVWTER